ncbi:MAG: sigma-70 family RNA polymerase sigma factor [Candidatus Dadabacteria bacterium]|nr:MAG: sigma-70 family RNA polymerase sigma factor [Candidatus Dadabacteria bacterium]
MMECGQAMASNADQYGELYDGHYRRILRLCRLLLGDFHLGEEVCQEVFLRLHVALSEAGSRETAWDRWLTRVAVNACRDVVRRRWWRLRHSGLAREEREEELPATCGDPESTLAGRRTAERIAAALASLTPRQREVFLLRHFEQWRTDEVADALGLDPGSVKRHLYRAVRKLRRALEDTK